MNYKKILPIIGCLLCSIAIGAGKEHDNNIVYTDGEPMHIISKKGVQVELTGGEGVDFSVEKNNASILKANDEGLRVKDKLLETIIEEEVERKFAEIRELLRFVRAFRYDYTAFKVLEDARFNFVYDEIGHTSLTSLNSNDTVQAFNHIMVGTDKYFIFRSAGFANGTGLLGTVGSRSATGQSLGAALFKLNPGTDPTVASNWRKVDRLTDWPVITQTAGVDGQKYFGQAYFRSIYFNEKDGKWYGLRQAYGIWSSTDGESWTREPIIDKNGSTITAQFINTYHLAIGADGTMVATTEYGPVYKLHKESTWKVLDIPGHDPSTPIRAVATGNAFVIREEEPTPGEVRLSRDLAAGNPLLPGIKSRFVIGSTAGEGIWYSDPEDITVWKKAVTANPRSGVAGAEDGSFRQIVYHNGTFIAPIFYTTEWPSGERSTSKKGIYYSDDALTWHVSEETLDFAGTESKWYEPQFALGMFIVPTPWSNGKLAVCTDPTQSKWKLISGDSYGYGVSKTEFGAIVVGGGGVRSIKSSAYFMSGSVPTKSDVYTKAEVDELIRRAIEESRNSRSQSLQ